VAVLLAGLMVWVLGMALGVFPAPATMQIAAGEPLPDFDLTTARNPAKHYTRGVLQGKGVLLNFFAHACAPCEQELKVLRRIHRRYQGEQFIIVGVTAQETRLAASFLDYHKVPWPTLMDRQAQLRGQVGVAEFPTSVFVNAKGIVAGIHRGPLTWKSASNAVEQLIISTRAEQKKAGQAQP
jgi:peroxiredoxin